MAPALLPGAEFGDDREASVHWPLFGRRQVCVLFLLSVFDWLPRPPDDFMFWKSRRLHAAEADVITAGVNVPFAARSHHVTGAILIRAEERTAAMHPLGLVIAGIVAGGRTLRIAYYRTATRQLEPRIIVRPIPVAAPLPHVARHVVKSVAVRRELCDRCDAGKAIRARVLHRKLAFINIRH